MDHKTERETRDFIMSVESFSQLPFLRPSPPPPLKELKAIRLFGKEFGVITNTNSDDHLITGRSTNNTREAEPSIKDTITMSSTLDNNNNNNNNTSHRIAAATRKFECHYCCRIFPTSQALGGHQNAHKRERQHAKRAHFQSTTNGHNYYSYTPITTLPSTITNYHSWNNSSSSSSSQYYSASTRLTNNVARLYGSSISYHHQKQPTNGSPLPMWRIPSAAPPNNPPQINPLFNCSKDDHRLMTTPPFPALRTSGLNTQKQLIGYESKPRMQDNRHMSLDLHL